MQAGIDHQLRDFGDAADILDAVGIGEAEIAVEAVADIVAVEQIGDVALGMELLLDEIGDGRFAGARQSGEPQHGRLLAGQCGACRLVHVDRLPVDVGGAAQGEIDEPHADRVVGEAVDDDEASRGGGSRHRARRRWARSRSRLHTPISLRASVLAATCSSVLTLTLYFELLEGARHGCVVPT